MVAALASSISSSQVIAGAQSRRLKAGIVSIPQRPSLRRSFTVQATGNRPGQTSVGRDANAQVDESVNDFSEKLQNTFEDLQEKWDDADSSEKTTAVLLSVAAFVTLWSAGGLLDAINRLPLIGGLLEVVGLGVTAWFVYRYLGTAEDRKELSREFDSFLQKVGVRK